MYFDLNYVIEQVGKEKGIPKETLIAALEEAIRQALQLNKGENARKRALENFSMQKHREKVLELFQKLLS